MQNFGFTVTQRLNQRRMGQTQIFRQTHKPGFYINTACCTTFDQRNGTIPGTGFQRMFDCGRQIAAVLMPERSAQMQPRMSPIPCRDRHSRRKSPNRGDSDRCGADHPAGE